MQNGHQLHLYWLGNGHFQERSHRQGSAFKAQQVPGPVRPDWPESPGFHAQAIAQNTGLVAQGNIANPACVRFNT